MLIESILFAALSLPRVIDEISIEVPTININEEKITTPKVSPTPKPTKTPRPTATPKPSKTPKPTRTPRPTSSPKQTILPKPTIKPTSIPNTSTINQQNILNALNNYRQKNGIAKLSIDSKLQTFAQKRADDLKAQGKLDNHEGFRNYIQNQNGFTNLGFNALAENQSWNYKGTPTGLIESLYGKSSGHNKNQLNPTYTHVGIGISGVYTNLVFGGKKK